MSGANVESIDVMGNDPFMFASIFKIGQIICSGLGVKDWDLNRENAVLEVGGLDKPCVLVRTNLER